MTARSSLLAAHLLVAVGAGVVDRHAGPAGQQDDGLFVGLVEAVGALLVGQVEVAPRLAVHEDRHPEERAHVRMAVREAVRARVVGDVVEAQRPRVADQHPENATAVGQVADRAVGLGIDADGQEALELAALLVEDAQRGEPRAGELAGLVEHALQDRLEV
ncbi:MAG: hypothetical protein R2736_22120 [Solirubrobacterales bacterium]